VIPPIVYIYALCEPDGVTIRYVGKSKSPQNRFRGHIRNAGDHTYCSRWISSVVSSGKLPILMILEECSSDVWQEREQWWIESCRLIGFNLTNLTSGGAGFHDLDPEIIERRSASMRGKKKSSNHAKKLGVVLHRDRNYSSEWTLERREKFSERMKGNEYGRRCTNFHDSAYQSQQSFLKWSLLDKEQRSARLKKSWATRKARKLLSPVVFLITPDSRIQ